MSILLDTHTALWFFRNDPQLTSLARDTICAEDQDVFISPASYWEIAIKVSIGKFSTTIPFDDLWRRLVADNDFRILPIHIRHAAVLATLPYVHRDPFDRMIVAQALADGLQLVSADALLDGYGIKRIW